MTIPTMIITYSTPSGETLALCAEHDAARSAAYFAGEQFCNVHRGRHIGDCDVCCRTPGGSDALAAAVRAGVCQPLVVRDASSEVPS